MTVYVLVREEFGEGHSVCGIYDNFLKAFDAKEKLEGEDWSNYFVEEWEVE